jgi:signal peptidase I
MDVKAQSPANTVASPDGAQPARGKTEKGEAKPETLGSFAWFLLKLLVAVLIFRSFVFSPFSIPSESMLPRLMNGDFLLAAKWPYGYSNYSLPFNAPLIPGRVLAGEPERGDIVIFKHPIDETDYIKRVIALPGDTVAMTGGTVILNGEALPRTRISDFVIELSPNTSCKWGGREVRVGAEQIVCRYTRYRQTLPGGRTFETLDFGITPADTFAPTRVPERHMFVLGDNRDNSRDSRFEARSGDAVGIVPQDLLVGQASIIMFSTDGSAEWANPLTWFTATRWDRIGQTL